jgi:CBS domain-containing protein
LQGKKKRVIDFARTNLVTCSSDSTITEIAKKMKEHSVGSVFISSEKDKIMGMVTDRKIFDLIADGINPLDMNPIDLMEEIHTVDEDLDLRGVLKSLKGKDISRVGITNQEGKIIGVISLKTLKSEQYRILKEELGIEA